MQFEYGINPNCSECAFVIYSDSLNKCQKELVNSWLKVKELNYKTTAKGNICIDDENNDFPNGKEDLWDLRDSIEEIAKYLKVDITDGIQFKLIRDDSYFDMLDNGDL